MFNQSRQGNINKKNTHAQDESGDTALTLAIKKGDLSNIKSLIVARADLEIPKHNKPLQQALIVGESKIIIELLRAGAIMETMKLLPYAKNINKVHLNLDKREIKKINVTDRYGKTPLHIFAEWGNVSGVSYLIETKANINCKDKENQTPLEQAIKNRHSECVKLLVETGANIAGQFYWLAVDTKDIKLIYPLLIYTEWDFFSKRYLNDFFDFLLEQDSNIEEVVLSFLYLDFLKQKWLESPSSAILFDQEKYQKLKNIIASLTDNPHIRKTLLQANDKLIKTIDEATRNYLPLEITEMVTEYEDMSYRMFHSIQSRYDHLDQNDCLPCCVSV